MGRRFDAVIGWLMRPRVRGVRRWSFVGTIPISLVVGPIYGAHQGILVIAVRVALWGAIALVAWRLGGERGEALRDLLASARTCLRAGRSLTSLPRSRAVED